MITHFTNYYGQTERLKEIYADWDKFPPRFRTMVIDDGHRISAVPSETQPHTLARITEDIPFNFAGTINLAAALCDTPWLLHTDMDVAVSPEDARDIIDLVEMSSGREVFHFNLHLGPELHVSSSSWLCPLSLFWELGGFDEDFSGSYGWDDVYFKDKCNAAGDVKCTLAPFTLRFVPSAASDIVRDTERNGRLLGEKRQTFSHEAVNPLRFGFRVVRVSGRDA